MKRRTTIAVTAAAVLAAAGGLTAVALPAAAAAAAAVRVEGTTLRYAAGGDAVNDLIVAAHGAGFVLRERSSATLTLDPARRGPCLQLGTREVYCDTRSLQLHAELGAGDDRLDNGHGANLATLVLAGDGRDELIGGSGADRLYGGDDRDILSGHDGNDTLDGQNGVDTLLGGNGDDSLLNPAKTRDSLFGEHGNDTIDSGDRNYGGSGDDVIRVQKGFGDFWGGSGFDVLDYAAWPYQHLVMSMDGNDNDGSGECPNCEPSQKPGRHNVHGDFEKVQGSPGNDRITGNDEADVLEGRGGIDHLYGSGGDDVLDAGPGTAQVVDGGSGTDTCRGENLRTITRCDIL